jgi:hypothetical protein
MKVPDHLSIITEFLTKDEREFAFLQTIWEYCQVPWLALPLAIPD